ncbi:MAG: nitronate monooxygenase [Lentisphaeria bacterium]|nr:nitronate monooxygenase [Lentisphaeria bacterium]
MTEPISNRFFEQGRAFLQCRYPILCGAMTWISDARLVAAMSEAGGFASLAGGNAPPEIFEAEIAKTRELTDRPFAVNLVSVAPAYQDQIAVLENCHPEYVIFAGSFPSDTDIRRVKATGAKVLCFASTISIARRMVKRGADAIILEGMEAGGHVGHVSLIVLLQQVLFQMSDVPVFVAGGVAGGRMCANLFLMGAAGVQLGTRFAVSEESCAHPDFKKAYVKAKARDAVSTPQFDRRLPVIAVRILANDKLAQFEKLQLELVQQLNRGEVDHKEAVGQIENFWIGGLRNAVMDGDVAHGSLMAGQSVGLVDHVQSVSSIVEELVEEIEAEFQRVKAQLV